MPSRLVIRAGQTEQQSNAIALGYQAGQTSQQANGMAIGYQAGQTMQQANAIALGYQAGQTGQGSYGMAIGTQAGQTGQQIYGLAIGYQAQSIQLVKDNDGYLDITFGTNGIVRNNISGYDVTTSVTIDNLNRIVVIGLIGEQFAIARYNDLGILDISFGPNQDGIIITEYSFEEYSVFGILLVSSVVANSVAIDSSNRIIVAGCLKDSSDDILMLTRYTPQGDIDTSFGTNGIARLGERLVYQEPLPGPGPGIERNYEIYSVLIDRFGRIVVAGYAKRLDYFWWIDPDTPGHDPNVDGYEWRTYFVEYAFFLARYTAGGQLDTSFGQNGIVEGSYVEVTLYKEKYINSVIIDSSDRIVVGGVLDNNYALARFTDSGILDTSFGTNGFVTNTSIGTVQSIALDSLNRIIACGGSTNRFGGFTSNFVVRYTDSGILETIF